MQPLISCLMPVYNGEAYLAEALDSILAQTVQDFEIVAVNDGSTDNSLAILEKYRARDPRVRIHSKPNGGIVSALNEGLALCLGEFIARMDCDDIAFPDRFEVQLAEFRAHPQAVGVGGMIRGIDGDGNLTFPPALPGKYVDTDLTAFPPKVACLQHSAATFRRSAMVAIGGYRNAFPHAEDWDLYLRLSAHGQLRSPDKLVIYYRQHANSLSMRNLVQQETSAVLAEISAIAVSQGRPDPAEDGKPRTLGEYNRLLGNETCPVLLLERYLNFRLWRRAYGASLAEERTYRHEMFSTLLKPSNYFHGKGRSLNLRIVLSVLNKIVREGFAWRLLRSQ